MRPVWEQHTKELSPGDSQAKWVQWVNQTKLCRVMKVPETNFLGVAKVHSVFSTSLT